MIDGGNISFDKKGQREDVKIELDFVSLAFLVLKVYRKVCLEGTYIVVLDYL